MLDCAKVVHYLLSLVQLCMNLNIKGCIGTCDILDDDNPLFANLISLIQVRKMGIPSGTSIVLGSVAILPLAHKVQWHRSP